MEGGGGRVMKVTHPACTSTNSYIPCPCEKYKNKNKCYTERGNALYEKKRGHKKIPEWQAELLVTVLRQRKKKSDDNMIMGVENVPPQHAMK